MKLYFADFTLGLQWQYFLQLPECLAKTPLFWRTFWSNLSLTFLSGFTLVFTLLICINFFPFHFIDAFSLTFNSFSFFFLFYLSTNFPWMFLYLLLTHVFSLVFHGFFCLHFFVCLLIHLLEAFFIILIFLFFFFNTFSLTFLYFLLTPLVWFTWCFFFLLEIPCWNMLCDCYLASTR